MLCVFIVRNTKLLRGRFVSNSCCLEKQSGVLPLPLLCSYLDCDLRLCLLSSVVSLLYGSG